MAAEADRFVRHCLPAGCEPLYESFSYRHLKDNLADPRSVFMQPQNLDLIQPIQTKVLKALLEPGEKRHTIVGKNGRVDSEAVKQYARLENDILANISMHFALTCGISPREFQYKTLLYDSLQDGTLKWRNLFLMHNCWCLGHPDAKKTAHGELAECLWVLTDLISMPLTFSIGVIRQIITELMRMIRDEISVSRESRIFVRNYPTMLRALDNDVMSGSDVNANMQRLSPDLPVRLTCNLLRSMVTTLLEHCSPMVLAKKKNKEEQRRVHSSLSISFGAGDGSPPPLSAPSPFGCLTADVTNALTSIILAVEEWDTGVHEDLTGAGDHQSMEHFAQREHPEAWAKFSAQVHSPRPIPSCVPRQSWPVRGLVHKRSWVESEKEEEEEEEEGDGVTDIPESEYEAVTDSDGCDAVPESEYEEFTESEEHDIPESGFEGEDDELGHEGGRDGGERFESGGLIMMLDDEEDEKSEMIYL
ncbi:hypothetical protein PILCRDRAFT_12756 [Piloderma croceum F 1598]|uniref:Uncharacterized protein n=1 Tax=Piloderma croceum (strain F 1598) TaxID=765440 RepID=A0A0C3BGQ5_PILCF|nr:hypothetical protein PILCRDRAFT_12756 [Piloderma croceum F 1598]